MAVDFTVKGTRGSTYDYYPEELAIPAKFNGRYNAPKTERMKQSILRCGQLQPVVIRSNGGIPTLFIGFTRWRAFMEINRDGLAPGGIKLKIQCVFRKGINENKGLALGIEENLFRNPTTDLDDAHNIALLDSFGQSHEEIAEIYGRDVPWVKARIAMASLSEEAQIAVTTGRLKPTAAATIAKLSEEQQRELVSGDGKVTGAMIDKATGKPPKPTAAKFVKILRAVIDEGTYPDGFEFVNSKDPINDSISAFCESVLTEMGVKLDAK